MSPPRRKRRSPTMKQNNETGSLSRLIAQRRSQALLRQEAWDLLTRVIIIAVCAVILFSEVFLITQAHGYDMFPSIKDGDLVIGFRLESNYNKGDVVVCRVGEKTGVRRVLARGGDVVNIGDQGTVQVNGANQGGDIMYPTYAKEGIEYPYQVPDGTVFVLGDYRTQTTDSRDVGPIPEKDVSAKVITILRRRGL